MSNPQKKSHCKLIAILVVIFIILPFTAIYFGILKQHKQLDPKSVQIDGSYLIPAKDIIEFKLTDNKGQPFTNENLKNHWTMMFFGFSNCGMVCPTTLTSLNKMYQILKRELPDKQLPQVVMVSVDPERDTVEKMDSYIKAFNPSFIGVRGELSDLEPIEKHLHIVAVKMQGDTKDKDDYYYDHSAEILLINPEGKVQAYLSYPHKPEILAKEFKLIRSIG